MADDDEQEQAAAMIPMMRVIRADREAASSRAMEHAVVAAIGPDGRGGELARVAKQSDTNEKHIQELQLFRAKAIAVASLIAGLAGVVAAVIAEVIRGAMH